MCIRDSPEDLMDELPEEPEKGRSPMDEDSDGEDGSHSMNESQASAQEEFARGAALPAECPTPEGSEEEEFDFENAKEKHARRKMPPCERIDDLFSSGSEGEGEQATPVDKRARTPLARIPTFFDKVEKEVLKTPPAPIRPIDVWGEQPTEKVKQEKGGGKGKSKPKSSSKGQAHG
eukprot:8641814-Pyramimonas_sp.AAC.1